MSYRVKNVFSGLRLMVFSTGAVQYRAMATGIGRTLVQWARHRNSGNSGDSGNSGEFRGQHMGIPETLHLTDPLSLFPFS